MKPYSDLHAFIRSRRSVRHFLAQDIPLHTLHRILETATYAPSAHNRQPWRFVVLTARQSRLCLSEAMEVDFRRDLLADGLSTEQVEQRLTRSRNRLLEAPVAIVLCLESAVLDRYPDARRQQAEALMGVQSVALAGGALLLAAHAEGLGGVWMCAPLFAPQAVRQALNLPQSWLPQGLLLLGIPAQLPETPARRPLEEVTLYR